MTLVLLALAALIAGAVAAVVLHRRPRAATAAATLGVLAAAGLGLPPGLAALAGAPFPELRRPWPVPGGEIVLGLDPLTGFFLIPLLALAAAAAVYGRSYLLAGSPGRNLAAPACLFNLCVAAMILVLLARHALVFLVAWELMSLTSYLLVTFDHGEPEVRRAGWAYLISAHVGFACLVGLFLVLGHHAGDLGFAAFSAARLAAGPGGLLAFGLATLGFGIKAGLVPVHVWLPEAHAAAPSHVSALMSGILIKLGVYGLLRALTFLEPARYWGPVLLALGLGGALLGIALALAQRDLKRVLAYSSIENVGIVLIGLGVAFQASVRGQPAVALLGACGGLLHLLHHAAGKGLLFLCAGSVLHGSGSRDLERLGGLLRRMPRTGGLMILGAITLAGLPPLGLFVSEWLIVLGLVRGAIGQPGATALLLLLAIGGLALVGGLAALCYTRLLGIALLGEPRSEGARQAHEAPAPMVGAMAALALLGLLAALLPGTILAGLGPVLGQILPGASPADLTAALAPVGPLAWVIRAVWALLALLGLGYAWHLRRRPAARAETWGCGYLAPTARMQYTASSFSGIAAESLLPRSLGARLDLQPPVGVLPGPARLAADYTDPLTRGVYQPWFDRWAGWLARLRWLHQGILHVYLLYILLVVVGALAWSSVRP